MWWSLCTTSLVVCFIALYTVQSGSGESIRFTLSAKYLPEMDLGGYNDPYVNIYAKDFYSRHYIKVAQTRIQHGAKNPRWPEVFDYYFIKGAGQKLKFTVRDWDFGWNQDDDLGKVELFVEDLVNEIHKISNETRARQDNLGTTAAPNTDTSAGASPSSIKLYLMKPRGGVLLITPMTMNGTQMSAYYYGSQQQAPSPNKSNKKTKEQDFFDLTK